MVFRGFCIVFCMEFWVIAYMIPIPYMECNNLLIPYIIPYGTWYWIWHSGDCGDLHPTQLGNSPTNIRISAQNYVQYVGILYSTTIPTPSIT